MRDRSPFLLLSILLISAPLNARSQTEARHEMLALRTDVEAVTSRYIFSAAYAKYSADDVARNVNSNGAPISCWIYDRATAAFVSEATIPFDYRQQQIIRWIALDDQICLVFERWDESHKVFEIWARVFALPEMKEQGEPFKVTRMEFMKKTAPPLFQNFTPTERSLVVSEDGTKACFYYDQIADKEHEQLVITSVFTSKGPFWDRIARIPFDSEKIENAGVTLSNEGNVHYLLKAFWNKYTLITNRKVRHSFVLYSVNGDGSSEHPLNLPEGNAAVAAGITVSSIGRSRIAGTYVGAQDPEEHIAGYFHADLAPDRAELGAAMLHPITEVPPSTSSDVVCLEGANGTSYLASERTQISDMMKIKENGFLAAAISEDGQEIWRRMVLRWNEHKSNMGTYFAVDHGELLSGFADTKDNIAAFMANTKPGRTRGSDTEVAVFARFGPDGAPTWEYLPEVKAYAALRFEIAPDVYYLKTNKDLALLKFIGE
jgi:hypothetical protein